MSAESHEVAVVGGGIAGLAAAWALRDRDVVLLEASERVGGRIRVEARDPQWLDFGAHLIGDLDSPMGRLAAELEAQAIPVRGQLGVWLNGRLVRGGSMETMPLRLALPLAARLSLMRTGLRLRRVAARAGRGIGDPIHGDQDYGGDVVRVVGDPKLDARTFLDVLGPMHEDVAALFRAASNRVAAEAVEMSAQFGMPFVASAWNANKNRHILRGGLSSISDAIARHLGNRISTGTRITRVVAGSGGASIRALQGEQPVAFSARQVIMATPAPVVRAVVDDLPADKAVALDAVRYGPYVVAAVRTREAGPTTYDDLTGVIVAGRTICSISNTMGPVHANSAGRAPGGTLKLFAGGWRAAELMGSTDEEIRDVLLGDLHAVLPETHGRIEEAIVHRWVRGFPYWAPGRLARQEALARPVGNIHFAGDYLEYPATDPAVRTGLLAARNVRALLDGPDRGGRP